MKSTDGDGLKLAGTTNRIDIVANSNRGGAANTILELDAHWNNTSVSFISFSLCEDVGISLKSINPFGITG